MMAKLYFMCVLLFSTTGFSQNHPLKYGIKGGWNYSNVNATDENGGPSGYRSDIIDEAYGGLALQKQLTAKSYLQSGLLVSFTDRVTFIELPVFYKYNLYNDFSLFAGPKFEYIPDEQDNAHIHFRKRTGFSANLGLEYKISNKWVVEGYASKGFVKQYDDLILTFYGSKRNVFRIGVTYFFN